ncbi:MAG: hypothetical protein AB7P69_17595 [Candidatus Binatia bacterium]
MVTPLSKGKDKASSGSAQQQLPSLSDVVTVEVAKMLTLQQQEVRAVLRNTSRSRYFKISSVP